MEKHQKHEKTPKKDTNLFKSEKILPNLMVEKQGHWSFL